MVYVYIVLTLIIIFVAIARFTNPEVRFAKGVARAQLITFLALKEKKPHLKGLGLYKEILGTRSGYDEDKIEKIISLARENNPSDVNLRRVVTALIISEYFDRVGLRHRNKSIGLVAVQTADKMFSEDI